MSCTCTTDGKAVGHCLKDPVQGPAGFSRHLYNYQENFHQKPRNLLSNSLMRGTFFSIFSVEDERKIVDSLTISQNKLGYFNSDAFFVTTLARITSQGKTIRSK